MDEVTLRPAKSSDVENMFAWRNASETRQYSSSAEPLSREEHTRWFADTLGRKDRMLLIGESVHGPVGVLRYDITGEIAEVSVYLVPGQGGKGLGSALIAAGTAWARVNLPKVARLRARILAANAASQKAFEKSGFMESYRVFEYRISGNSE
jgi:UDP-2,4-diacetamido-2,4,6-trideoxy-beta-L-altropyranose hydrolase